MGSYQDLASRLAQAASERLGASFVSCYLLGSSARGEERLGTSDVDVLIVVRGKRVLHQWDRFPPSFSFLEGFAGEAEQLARDAMAPRPPLRQRFLVTTVVGRESIRREANGVLYFDLQGARLLAGAEVRRVLRMPSWKALDVELLEDISRWRERMVANLSSLDIWKEPHRLASYAVMYALPTAGAYIALKRRRLVTSKSEIPGAFMKEFPGFESAPVLEELLEEYLNWRWRDTDLARLSSLWLRSLKFILEVQREVNAMGSLGPIRAHRAEVTRFVAAPP